MANCKAKWTDGSRCTRRVGHPHDHWALSEGYGAVSWEDETVFNAYLPIPATSRGDTPAPDSVWLAARGIEAEALTVLRLVRDEVLPLVRGRRFSFLVHDRTSGVPTAPDDHGAYIHLRVTGKVKFPKKWVMVKEVKPTAEEKAVHEVLDEQCAWYLRLVEKYAKLPDEELLLKIRQHLHFFANMSQMRIA